MVVDPKKEKNAVHEAHLIGAKMVGLIDTDSDPDVVDLPIPGNDDSIRSIRLILEYLVDAIKRGRSTLPEEPKAHAQNEPKAIPSL